MYILANCTTIDIYRVEKPKCFDLSNISGDFVKLFFPEKK